MSTTETMRAVQWTAYGSPEVMQMAETAMPTTGAHAVLIRVKASTVTTADARLRRFDVTPGVWLPTRLMFGLRVPRKPIAGMDFAGEVVKVGDRVDRFNVGDRVFGTTGPALGAHADYVSVNQASSVALLPDNATDTDAVALIFGGLTAQYFLTDRVKTGDRVLINGASGAVGSSALQLAKDAGAHVTGVCSGVNTELVRRLGADEVIDYQAQDVLRSGNRYHVIVDTVGNLSYHATKASLTDQGRFIQVNASLSTLLQAALTPKMLSGMATENADALLRLATLYSANALRPVIDAVLPIEQIVQAHARVDTGRKRGSVVLTHGERQAQPK